MPFEPKVDVDEDCLICCEPLNHDLNFYPCPCEFQVTLWSFRKKIGLGDQFGSSRVCIWQTTSTLDTVASIFISYRNSKRSGHGVVL